MRQLERAIDWWELNRPDAPDTLAEDVQEMVARIDRNPMIGELVRSRRFRDVRRRLTQRTHYHVYFRPLGEDIEVVAVWHASRGSGPPI